MLDVRPEPRGLAEDWLPQATILVLTETADIRVTDDVADYFFE
jgi:hypothetical protein